MAYYVVVAGSTLYKMTSAGVATALTLPTDITLSATRAARMAVLGRNVVVVNTGLRNLFVDPDLTVRPLSLTAPISPCVLAAGASGSLTGAYLAKYTYVVKDPRTGAVIVESPLSPASLSVTVASKLLAVTGIGICPDASCTHRQLYRTTNGGSSYFPWLLIDGNVNTAATDGISDAGLQLFTAETDLGSPPGAQVGTYMTLIASWKNRLWGVGDIDIDTILFSGDGLIYGWPTDNSFDVAPVGVDIYGITGLIPRRDEFGIAKRNILWKIVGTNPDDFQLVKVVEGKGCYATDSVVVVRDVGYFLGEDGVYAWGPDGVQSVSDERVRGWFATDTYFARSQFPNAFAKYNAKYHTYELHLAAAGSTNIDRWVSYDIARKEWFGPHKTTAFTPTAGGQIVDTNNLTVPVLCGSDGYIRTQNASAFSDDGSAITLSLIGKSHTGDAPDLTKLFGELSLISKAESGSGSLTIGVANGAVGATVQKTYTADLTKGRQRFGVLGKGRAVRLDFTEATLNQGCQLEGYEIPFGVLGRR